MIPSKRLVVVVSAALVGSWVSCSASSGKKADDGAKGVGGSTAVQIDANTGGLEDAVFCRSDDPDQDVDGDGFTANEGDCDDCDPNRNPNAIEVVVDDLMILPKDEDCDGEVDEDDSEVCDTGLELDDEDPMNAARALDLCKVSSGSKDWGVVRAAWVLADGAAAPPSQPLFHVGHGILPKFGAVVTTRRGERMTALSSGTARQPTDPGYESPSGFQKNIVGNHPPGFPKEAPACPGVTSGQPNDPVALEVELRVPSNAHGLSFDFNFFTYEWPDFVCSEFNDFFVALLSPYPEGQTDGNISFDSQGNPVGVNSAFVTVCGCLGNPPSPCIAGGKSFSCPQGNLDLVGTGFGGQAGFGGDHASTGWLQTTAPVEPGSEITLRWAVYDSGDPLLDTTTLIDNFRWLAEPGIEVVTRPPIQ